MGQFILTNSAVFLQYIEKDPGVIVGPIASFLGAIINFVFGIISSFSPANSLGWSIIVLTLVARTLMLPLGFKSQKSMVSMQKITPEVNKIREKYGTSKDPEIQRKMNAEIQALYAKHKVNPLSGCLPLLIQMPIFFALSFLFRQSYLFIGGIGDIYKQLGESILQIDGWESWFMEIARVKIPENMMPFQAGIDLVHTPVNEFENLLKLLNRFNLADWNRVLENAGGMRGTIEALFNTKVGIETFFGINLVENSGMGWPGILIPILTAATTFLSSYIMNKTNPASDPSAQSQQKIMMMVMPVMMIFMTVNMSAGVGLYWIVSSVYQTAQQYFLHKYYTKDSKKEAVN